MQDITPSPERRFIDTDRLPRIRRHIAESELDGFIAFSPPNSYYLSGCYAGMYSRPVIGLVTPEESAFVGPRLEQRKADRTAWTDRALLYEDSDDPFDVLAEAISDDIDTLGYDAAQSRPDWATKLESQVTPEFVDASDKFLSLRIIKTEWELDKIRRARDLASAGCEEMFESVRSGHSELEVVADVQQAYYDIYLDQHAEFDSRYCPAIGSGLHL